MQWRYALKWIVAVINKNLQRKHDIHHSLGTLSEMQNSQHLHIPIAGKDKKKRFPKEELVKTAASAAATRKQGTH